MAVFDPPLMEGGSPLLNRPPTMPSVVRCAAPLLFLAPLAQGQTTQPATQQLDPVLVTAPMGQLQNADFSSLPPRDLLANPVVESPGLDASTSVVGRKEIDLQHAATVTEALNFVPGAWTETRGRKVKQFLSLRGQTYPYPSYDIDGAWFRDFDDTGYFFHTAAVDRLEVVRSSGTLLLSPGDLAGVVNIVPRAFTDATTQLDTVYGSNNYTSTQLMHGRTVERLSYAVGGGYQHTDGPDDRDGQENIGNYYARVAFAPTESLTLSFTAVGITGERDFELATPPATNSLRTRSESFDPLNVVMLVGKAHLQTSDRASTQVIVNFAYRDTVHHTENLADNNERDNEHGVRIVQTLAVTEDNTLRVSGFFNHWASPTGKRFYAGSPADLWTYSLAAVDEHRFGDLLLNVGYRLTQTYFDEFGGYNIEGTAGALGAVELVDTWQDVLHTLSTGAAYELSPDATLMANVTWGMVAADPGALDINLQSPGIEEQTKFDLGLRQRWRDMLETTVTGFVVYQDGAAALSNSVVIVNGDEFALVQNADRISYGVEAEARSVRLDNGLQFFGNVTLTQSQQTTGGNWDRNREMPQVIVGAGTSWLFHHFEPALLVKYFSGYENNRFMPANSAPADLGDAVNVTASVSYYFGSQRRSRVWAAVENVLNEGYSTVAGYPAPGRQFKVGLTLLF